MLPQPVEGRYGGDRRRDIRRFIVGDHNEADEVFLAHACLHVYPPARMNNVYWKPVSLRAAYRAGHTTNSWNRDGRYWYLLISFRRPAGSIPRSSKRGNRCRIPFFLASR